MLHSYNSRKKVDKNNSSNYSSSNSSKKQKDQGRNQKSSFSSRPSGSRGPKKKVIKFDPSIFMKKSEEQVVQQAYVPKNLFSDFSIDNKLKLNIGKKGYIAPTPIQDQAIPHILEGRDVVGTANTGTGKTAAFLIPLINNALAGKTSRILIIAPTRELAGQIKNEFRSFALNTGLTSVLCIGGENINLQMRALRSNPVFVIGTPGRLIDLQESRNINFGLFSSIVLDEVDRMLDMGFITDITSIIDKLPKKRHSLFFSATLSHGVQKVMSAFLKDPVSITVKTRQSAENVNQDVITVGQANKEELLHDLLIKPEYKKVLIFLRTKRGVDKLAKELIARGFKIGSMHGDKTQHQRAKALLLFKSGQISILLATDVVARGIDIKDISHVINFDMPQTYEDYIHRIGRTGRANNVGHAITFV